MARHPALFTFLIALLILSSGMLTALALAQARAAQTPKTAVFIVSAGGRDAQQSSVRFYPDALQVRRGDTITWQFHGAHNVHFRPAGVITTGLEQTIADGALYQGGDVNSGVHVASTNPDLQTRFSLQMDLAPGVYSYLCDLHPGMRGTIQVVGG